MLSESERVLWQDYQTSPEDLVNRDRLIEHYMPLVKYHATSMQSRLHDKLEHDYLVQAGVFGLIHSMERFDIERNANFGTYSSLRIRGAMLDEIRQMDWVPRLVRSRATKVSQLEQEGKEVPEMLREAGRVVSVSSMNEPTIETDAFRERTIGDDFKSREDDPSLSSQKADLLKLVTNGFSKNERLVVILYYYQSKTMREIGEQLGLSESRISQIHTSIIERLKDRLVDRVEEFLV